MYIFTNLEFYAHAEKPKVCKMKAKGNIMERRVRLKTVNPFIICYLCRGYLLDATTITECLHTFCKTCIVKHLQKGVCCPKCGLLIHQSHPLNYISHDRTMQAIVFKLVPGLQDREARLEQEFYKRRGLPVPKTLTEAEKMEENQTKSPTQNGDHHRHDEQVNLLLECTSSQLKSLKRSFIRCSSQATIMHLKKLLALKLYSNIERCKDVDILCNEELLGKDHTLKFICMTRSAVKDMPLKLQYKPKVVEL